MKLSAQQNTKKSKKVSGIKVGSNKGGKTKEERSTIAPIGKKKAVEQSPVSDTSFMINLQPVLRRAHTALVNFEPGHNLNTTSFLNAQRKITPLANKDVAAKKTAETPKDISTNTNSGGRRTKQKALKVKKKAASENLDNVYRPTSKWNDVISEKEIQKLVSSTCSVKGCRDRHHAQHSAMVA